MKNKVLMWCVRVEPDVDWNNWEQFARLYPQKGNTDPVLVDYVWYDFGFDTRKERTEFVKALRQKFPDMGKFGQVCLYKEVEG